MMIKYSGREKDVISKSAFSRLFLRMLGELFQAEEIEVINLGESCPWILIKTYQDIGYDEMRVLRGLYDSFWVSLGAESTYSEKLDEEVTINYARLEIEIMPTWETWEKIVKEAKNEK